MVVGFIIHEVQWRYFNRKVKAKVLSTGKIETEITKEDLITR